MLARLKVMSVRLAYYFPLNINCTTKAEDCNTSWNLQDWPDHTERLFPPTGIDFFSLWQTWRSTNLKTAIALKRLKFWWDWYCFLGWRRHDRPTLPLTGTDILTLTLTMPAAPNQPNQRRQRVPANPVTTTPIIACFCTKTNMENQPDSSGALACLKHTSSKCKRDNLYEILQSSYRIIRFAI